MKCMRCGYCCHHHLVVVVHPRVVAEDLRIDELPEADLMFLDGTEPCPFVSWEEDEAICSIHHYKWYVETPCFSHGQIEQSVNDLCRLGEYVRNLYDPVKDHILKSRAP